MLLPALRVFVVKKKSKGKPVSLHEFLGEENVAMVTSKPISWADEMENQAANGEKNAGFINRNGLDRCDSIIY